MGITPKRDRRYWEWRSLFASGPPIQTDPLPNDVEAVGYEHQHDFIVFSDAEGKPVRSFKSKVVRDVKLSWKNPDNPDDDAGFENL